jgi:hypothetical protein
MGSSRADSLSRLVAASAYVLHGEHICHECGCFVPVFGLMVVGPFEYTGDVLIDDDDDSALLRRIVDLAPDLQVELTSRSGGHFRPDDSKTVGERYWMNHCFECGAKIGDWFLHKPGEAFFPTTEDAIRRLRGFKLQGPHTFHDPDLAVTSWTTSWLEWARAEEQ